MNKLQKDLIVISDSKVIKVYKKPITKKILNSFSEIPKSASEISKTISFPKEKIYYHIKNLLKHDLLIIASANVVKGIEQKMYLPAAKVFKVSIKGSIKKEKTSDYYFIQDKLTGSYSTNGLEEVIFTLMAKADFLQKLFQDLAICSAGLLKSLGRAFCPKFSVDFSAIQNNVTI